MKKSEVHHDAFSILLHWSAALFMLCASLSIFFLYAVFSDGTSGSIQTFHILTGTFALVLVLVIVWLGWRARQAELPKLATISIGEARFMEITNGVLNGLLLLVPVTGILYLFALGQSIDLGLFKLGYAFSMSQQNLNLLELTHNVLGKMLLAVVFLHSIHGLWHQFWKRDSLVSRMLP